MNDSNLQRFYKKNCNIVSRFIDNETVLVPIKQKAGEIESIYTLNETGAYIWQLIDGKLAIADIAKKVVEKYDVSHEKAIKDLDELVTDLKKAGCIE